MIFFTDNTREHYLLQFINIQWCKNNLHYNIKTSSKHEYKHYIKYITTASVYSRHSCAPI